GLRPSAGHCQGTTGRRAHQGRGRLHQLRPAARLRTHLQRPDPGNQGDRMTENDCVKLRDFLHTPGATYTRPDRRTFLDSLTGVEGCIAAELSTSAEEEDW